MNRVTIQQVNKLASRLSELQELLQSYLEIKQDNLDNAEGADYPSDDRIERLSEQVEILSEALNGIDAAIEALEGYE